MRKIDLHPFSKLETDRLSLSWITLNESAFVELMRSHPSVNKFINRPDKISLEEAREFVQFRLSDHEKNVSSYWIIRSKDSEKPIGTISLWNFSTDMKKAELGYELHPDHQGKGYMSEAVNAILNIALGELDFGKIEACTHFKNKPSLLMLKRLGFVYESELEDEGHPDNVVYQIEKSTLC